MSSKIEFVEYIVEQASGAGEIAARKMMGDYCLYCNGAVVGLICDNCLFLKPVDALKEKLREVVLKSPYPGAKPYYAIEHIDDRKYLSDLIHTVYLKQSV
jgi:TfoX/Sxy family transcriptional regulator of competence genes